MNENFDEKTEEKTGPDPVKPGEMQIDISERIQDNSNLDKDRDIFSTRKIEFDMPEKEIPITQPEEKAPENKKKMKVLV